MRYVWDPFVRFFHWTLVIAFTVAFITHASEWYRLVHVNAGHSAGVLILLRIIWGLMNTGYAKFQSFPPKLFLAAKYLIDLFKGHARHFVGHNPAGSIVIYAILLDGLLTFATGYLVYNDGWLINEPDILQSMHFIFAWGWLGLVLTHLIGVITESFLHRENLIIAVFTGIKHSNDDFNINTPTTNVSRETINSFAQWTLAVKKLYISYTLLNKANSKIYKYIEKNDVVGIYGVKRVMKKIMSK